MGRVTAVFFMPIRHNSFFQHDQSDRLMTSLYRSGLMGTVWPFPIVIFAIDSIMTENVNRAGYVATALVRSNIISTFFEYVEFHSASLLLHL